LNTVQISKKYEVIWMVDSGVVVQQSFVGTGGLKQSFHSRRESFVDKKK